MTEPHFVAEEISILGVQLSVNLMSWLEYKSDNLQFNMQVRWDKWLVDQESDVPSIIFLILFIYLEHSKLFIFIVVIL